MSESIFKNSSDISDFINLHLTEEHPIVRAMHEKSLIFFIGSGLSVHLNMPSWEGFASNYVNYIYENRNTGINYKTKNDLKNINDKKKVLSLCRFIARENNIEESQITEWFEVKNEENLNQIYKKLYEINAIYVTTNYDDALDLLAQKDIENISLNNDEKSKIDRDNKNQKIFYRVEEFRNENIIRPGNIIHIHGSKESLESMVISNEDYLRRYGYNTCSNKPDSSQYIYSEFLRKIFNGNYTILFIGYGLEEIEILQYMFEHSFEKEEKQRENNRYMFLGGYSSDYGYIDILSQYYLKNYSVQIIPYDITNEGYDSEIIKLISKLYEFKNNKIVSIKSKLDFMEEVLSEDE